MQQLKLQICFLDLKFAYQVESHNQPVDLFASELQFNWTSAHYWTADKSLP